MFKYLISIFTADCLTSSYPDGRYRIHMELHTLTVINSWWQGHATAWKWLDPGSFMHGAYNFCMWFGADLEVKLPCVLQTHKSFLLPAVTFTPTYNVFRQVVSGRSKRTNTYTVTSVRLVSYPDPTLSRGKGSGDCWTFLPLCRISNVNFFDMLSVRAFNQFSPLARVWVTPSNGE